MGVKVAAGNCLQWRQPLLPHAPSHHQTLTSIFSCISSSSPSNRRNTLSCQISLHSPFLGATSTKLISGRRSSDDISGEGRQRIRRMVNQGLRTTTLSASLDSFSEENEEEFIARLEELAFNLREGCAGFGNLPDSPSLRNQEKEEEEAENIFNVEMKANSVDMPLSLRIIKKKRWESGFLEASESAYCSIKKAFSSMVFIVRELQSYTLQMREILFYENLQGILARVQGEMNASFVWLFQKIFSCTPTLMLYVMLLLANFTVYSIGSNPAISATVSSSDNSPSATVSVEHTNHHQTQRNTRFDASSIKSFSLGRTAAIGGNGGNGGNVKPVAGATDGNDDGSGSGSYSSSTIIPEGIPSTGMEEEGKTEMVMHDEEEEEEVIWRKVSEEASSMQSRSYTDTVVSPVKVELEAENLIQYSQTELMYHQALSQDPENVLLLSNFAQFLYVVLHDHDRAEYYFKRAVGIKPADAEAWNRYAGFLWMVREDLGAAEEAYLEAIAADPSNSYYAANYAHFLWNTGGEDTCYPLDGSGTDAC